MKKSGKSIVYWDSGVWISVIGKKKTEKIFDRYVYAMERVKRGDVRLVLSQIVRLELYQTNLSQENREHFSKILQLPNVEPLSVNMRIIEIASDLQREAGTAVLGKRLKSVDAIHLATAIYAQAGELYAGDGDLLKLNGVIKSRTVPKISYPPINPQGKLELKSE